MVVILFLGCWAARIFSRMFVGSLYIRDVPQVDDTSLETHFAYDCVLSVLSVRRPDSLKHFQYSTIGRQGRAARAGSRQKAVHTAACVFSLGAAEVTRTKRIYNSVTNNLCTDIRENEVCFLLGSGACFDAHLSGFESWSHDIRLPLTKMLWF